MRLTGNVTFAGTFFNVPILSELYSPKTSDLSTIFSCLRNALITSKAKVNMETGASYFKQAAAHLYMRDQRTVYELNGNFSSSFTVTSVATAKNKMGSHFLTPIHDIEKGNNIVLPSYCSEALQDAKRPIQLMVTTKDKKFFFCGCMDFVAGSGQAYFPNWMIKNIPLPEGTLVTLTSVTLQRGKSCRIQPNTKDFWNIPNPLDLLSKRFSAFTTLSEGDSITVWDSKQKEYFLDIIELKPHGAVNVFVDHGEELDLEMEFEEPLDQLTFKPQKEDVDLKGLIRKEIYDYKKAKKLEKMLTESRLSIQNTDAGKPIIFDDKKPKITDDSSTSKPPIINTNADDNSADSNKGGKILGSSDDSSRTSTAIDGEACPICGKIISSTSYLMHVTHCERMHRNKGK